MSRSSLSSPLSHLVLKGLGGDSPALGFKSAASPQAAFLPDSLKLGNRSRGRVILHPYFHRSPVPAMARTTKVSACHCPKKLKAKVRKFLNKAHPPIECLRQLASLPCECFLQVVRTLTPQDQGRFVDKVDRVRQFRVSAERSLLISPPSAKLYPTLDTQDIKVLAVIGEVCNNIDRPPTSAVIPARLGRRETSGGLTDIWSGTFDSERVALKAFRTYPDVSMREAKKVRIRRVQEVSVETNFFQILWKQVPVWKRFAHQNVMGLRGVYMDASLLALVYDWAEKGNIVQYTSKSHPGASRPALVLILLPNGFNYLTLLLGGSCCRLQKV